MIAGLPKRILRKYLFEFRVPLRWNRVKQVVTTSVQNVFDSDSPSPVGASAEELLAIKRSFEACRKREQMTTKDALRAEVALLETAADLGDPSAVSLLCGSRFKDAQDREEGSKLLTQLMDRKFPLAFKISGDLAYQLGQQSKAAQFWQLAIHYGLEDPRFRVECWRGIGHVAFKETRLFDARQAFNRACEESADIDPRQSADCHFYLAQLRESNREAARMHLEKAAGFGLSDAFIPLGTLLLNYFGEAALAREWFQLSLATDQTGAAVMGLFDSAIRLGDDKLAHMTLARIQRRPDAAALIGTRRNSIDRLKLRTAPTGIAPGPAAQAAQTAQTAQAAPKQDRWDF